MVARPDPERAEGSLLADKPAGGPPALPPDSEDGLLQLGDE